MGEKNEIEEALERLPYGVFIAAVRSTSAELHAILATWAMQVSFKPPLVALSLEKGSKFATLVAEAGVFSLSLLPESGIPVAKHVLKNGPASVDAELHALFDDQKENAPILRNSPATLTCTLCRIHESGDHLLVIGEVVGGTTSRAEDVLLLKKTGWKYRPRKT